MICFRKIPTSSDPYAARAACRAMPRRVALSLLLAAPFAFAGSLPVLADSVDEAKAAGLVGEKPDGYLGAVSPNPPPNIAKLVADTNAKRRQAYADIAAQNGTTVEAVAAIAAQKLYAKAAPGTYLMGADGTWQRK